MPKQTITAFIDFFYPPFKKLMPVQTFRYAACGGANTLLGLAVFKLLLVFYFTEEVVHIGSFAFESHNVALFISFCLNFAVGFLLMKYVVFIASNLRGRIQLFRYLLSFLFNLLLNYLLLKVFVHYWDWDAFLSQCISTVIIVTVSYLSQKHFTFKVKQHAEE